MITHKQRPSQPLSHIIDAYWMVENTTSKDIQVPILPDGCIDIIIRDDDILLVAVSEDKSEMGDTLVEGKEYVWANLTCGRVSLMLQRADSLKEGVGTFSKTSAPPQVFTSK